MEKRKEDGTVTIPAERFVELLAKEQTLESGKIEVVRVNYQGGLFQSREETSMTEIRSKAESEILEEAQRIFCAAADAQLKAQQTQAKIRAFWDRLVYKRFRLSVRLRILFTGRSDLKAEDFK